MKNQILNLGKALTKVEQKEVFGGRIKAGVAANPPFCRTVSFSPDLTCPEGQVLIDHCFCCEL